MLKISEKLNDYERLMVMRKKEKNFHRVRLNNPLIKSREWNVPFMIHKNAMKFNKIILSLDGRGLR
ncbi:MAG: hypothetical protein ABIL40_07725 [candidate division WOR-3 bacterium]